MSDDEDTTVRVKVSTRERMKGIGAMGDDYDSLINRLLDEHDKKAKK